jgi:hypothetical protein
MPGSGTWAIQLTQIIYDADTETYTVCFDYVVNGVVVCFEGRQCAAEVVIRNGGRSPTPTSIAGVTPSPAAFCPCRAPGAGGYPRPWRRGPMLPIRTAVRPSASVGSLRTTGEAWIHQDQKFYHHRAGATNDFLLVLYAAERAKDNEVRRAAQRIDCAF